MNNELEERRQFLIESTLKELRENPLKFTEEELQFAGEQLESDLKNLNMIEMERYFQYGQYYSDEEWFRIKGTMGPEIDGLEWL